MDEARTSGYPVTSDIIGNSEEVSRRRYFRRIRSFLQFDALIVLAQVLIFPNGRPDAFHKRPAQEFVALFGYGSML